MRFGCRVPAAGSSRSRRWVPLQFGLASLVAACAMAVFAQPAAAVPPNIIVIVTDDHRAAGTMDISDPDLDPMKKTKGWFHTGDLQVPGRDPVPGGTKFPNGIATTPLCCPARASIFTGQYIHNHG